MRAHHHVLVGLLAGCGDAASMTPPGATTDVSTTGSSTTESDSTDLEVCTSPDMESFEGEHFLIRARPDLELCGGTLRHMDEFIERLSARFDIEPPRVGDRICHAWLYEQEVQDYCKFSDSVRGCASPRQIVTSRAPHNHELVHSMAFRLARHYPPAFLAEGLAVAHEGYAGVVDPVRWSQGTDLGEILEASSEELLDVSDGYGLAARYTSYLIAQHGMSAYLDLYTTLSVGADLDAMDEAFQKTLGISLADSIAGFTGRWTTCPYDALLIECDTPEVAWDGEFLEMEGEVDCARDDAIGPYEGAGGRVVVHHTIHILQEGDYELRLAGDTQESTIAPDFEAHLGQPVHGVSLANCTPCSPGWMETVEGGTPRLSRLFPGKYTLRLHGRQDTPRTVAFTLKRLPPDPEGVFSNKDTP